MSARELSNKHKSHVFCTLKCAYPWVITEILGEGANLRVGGEGVTIYCSQIIVVYFRLELCILLIARMTITNRSLK